MWALAEHRCSELPGLDIRSSRIQLLSRVVLWRPSCDLSCAAPRTAHWQVTQRRRRRSRAPARSPLQLRLPETLRSGDDGQLRVLFLMGLPGAGKSTVKRQRLRPDDLDIEPDQMKRSLKGERRGRSVDAFEDAVRRRRRSILFDSSGSNASWLQRRIELAQRKGYVTELLWVDVPVEIALYRNRGRGFQNNRRGQFCPEHIILNKAKELSRYVCVAERMKNWCEGSYELEEAKEETRSSSNGRWESTCPELTEPFSL
eukprot:g6158.t1